MKTYFLHKLGCPKNDVDAEFICGILSRAGLKNTSRSEDADFIIVNTCGFIEAAKEESIATILTYAREKGNRAGQRLIVTGCLSQRYADDLADEIPELDGIFGIEAIDALQKYITTGGGKKVNVGSLSRIYIEPGTERLLSDDEPYAYLKISDGCDNRCSYCAIPDIRGSYRSRKIEAIVDEAKFLLDAGKREIILVSQESSRYGQDLYGQPHLIGLLDGISRLGDDFWLRVMYLHPARLTNPLIEYIIDNPRLCSYFDLPLQHVNDRLLGEMNRRVSRSEIEAILEKIRKAGKSSAIRTTFIVGFPGETDREFDELLDFIMTWRFDRMGAFIYSPEEGTRAADMPEQIDSALAQKRYEELMLAQQDIAFDLNREAVGQKLEVLIDRYDTDREVTVARTRFDAPEIDQEVLIMGRRHNPGEIIETAVTAFEGYDLISNEAGI